MQAGPASTNREGSAVSAAMPSLSCEESAEIIVVLSIEPGVAHWVKNPEDSGRMKDRTEEVETTGGAYE